MNERKFGQMVKAYPLDLEGPLVGFFLEQAGDKERIQVGDKTYDLAYREPADYDANGPNGTFCSI